MDAKRWTAIQELLDAAEYANTALDRYADYMDDPMGPVMIPNDAMTAMSCLTEAAEAVSKLMPNPETPMERLIARAEYEEDR